MWVKLLRDKQFMKLDSEIRWTWIGLLLLAGDSHNPGKIGISDEMGYSPLQIAHLLGVYEKTVQDTFSAMGCNSITIDEKGIITICKWEEYQSEYQRQVKYRNKGNSRLQPKVTKQGYCTEGEGEVDVYKKKEVKKEPIADKSAVSVNPTIKEPEKPKELTDIQKVVLSYKLKKGFERGDVAWDKMNFARCSKSAKQLLDYFKDWKIAVNCIDELSNWLDKQNLSWTLETICKHSSEWHNKKENNND